MIRRLINKSVNGKDTSLQALKTSLKNSEFENPIKHLRVERGYLYIESHGEGTFEQILAIMITIHETAKELGIYRVVYVKNFRTQISLLNAYALVSKIGLVREEEIEYPPLVAVFDKNPKNFAINKLITVIINTVGLKSRLFKMGESPQRWFDSFDDNSIRIDSSRDSNAEIVD